MILLNFAHPLTTDQLARIEELAGQSISDIREIPTHFEPDEPFAGQLATLIDSLDIDSTTWQTESFLINPPTLNVIVAVLMAELQGRMGYLPPVLRLRPNDAPPPPYQIAEIIDLQKLRTQARTRR